MDDSLNHFKKIAVNSCCKLLKAFPYLQTTENISYITNKIGDANVDIVQSVQRLVNFSLKNGGNFGKKVLSAIDVMISRPNLNEQIKTKLITSLANINFSDVSERDILMSTTKIFMREFISVCTRGEDKVKHRLEQGKKHIKKKAGVLKGLEDNVKFMN